MVERQISSLTRRRLFQVAGALALGDVHRPVSALAGTTASGLPSNASQRHARAQTGLLIDGVREICTRLAAGGWRDLLLDVTGNVMDITAVGLVSTLRQPLTTIDRIAPGFEDFSLEGVSGIEPGSPARSLLYHALASPSVFTDRAGDVLSLFPTPAELDTVENYVYGVVPPSLEAIHAQAPGAPLAVVVFALEYRSGPQTVHGKHADLNFSRTGHARLGNVGPRYDAQRRAFLPLIADDPHSFPVQQPARATQLLREDGRVTGVATADITVAATWVVDAGGGQHWLARQLDIRRRFASPRLIARYGYARGPYPVPYEGPEIRSDEHGWTWTAQVATDLYQWTRLSFSENDPGRDTPPAVFRALTALGPPRGADVRWRIVERPAGRGYLCSGDAATVLDPASSHGVLRALMSGMMAGHVITECERGAVPAAAAIRDYHAWIMNQFDTDVTALGDFYRSLDKPPHWVLPATSLSTLSS